MNTSFFIKVVIILFFVTFVFAGCSNQSYNTMSPKANETVEVQTETEGETAQEPIISNSTKTEDLQTELDGTIIFEEDFSDL